jgi:hypothetical protein
MVEWYQDAVQEVVKQILLLLMAGATLDSVSPGMVEIALTPHPAISRQHGFVHGGGKPDDRDELSTTDRQTRLDPMDARLVLNVRFCGCYWGQSGHDLLHCICLLLTQSGHQPDASGAGGLSYEVDSLVDVTIDDRSSGNLATCRDDLIISAWTILIAECACTSLPRA